VRSELQNCAAVMDAQLDVRELIALIAASRILLGNDSGPAHLAAALQRPSVVIFGVTDPMQWGPWQSDHRMVQTGATFDHPRGDKAIMVTNPRPISTITVDEVRQNCEELLAGG
jgi:heptosyltransferase III